MKKTRAKRGRLPPVIIHRRRTAASHYGPSVQPLAAVITCLDSASTTGVATYINGKLHDYGEVKGRDPAARLCVLRDHVTLAYMRGLPHGIVLEVPWGGQLNAALSLAATAALWRDSWAQLGNGAHLMLERTSNDWRRALFGKRTLGRDAARALEMHRACATIAADQPLRADRRLVVGPDAAAAICIGQVMIRSTELRIAIGCDLVASSRKIVPTGTEVRQDAVAGGMMPSRAKGTRKP